MRCLILLVAASGALTLRASSAQLPTLLLEDLIAEALERNPEIRAAWHRAEAARRRPAQRAALPDPMVSLGYTSVGRPYPLAGLGVQPMANAGLMITQELPGWGKRRLEAAIAREEARAEERLARQVESEVISRLKEAYHRLAYNAQAEENLRERLRLLEDVLRLAEARYAAGLAPQGDVLRIQTEITMLEAERERLAGQKGLLQAEINRLLSRPAESPLGRPARPAFPGELPPLEEWLEAASVHSPLLAERESRIAGAEVALHLGRRAAWPDMALSGGFFTMGAMGSMYMFRLDFRLPVFYGRKQRPAIAERFELLQAERRQLEAAALSLRFRIQEQHNAASVAARLARLYSTTLAPQALLAVEAALASYQSGEGDLGSVLANFATLLRYELASYEEIANFHVALTRLEALTGKVLLP